MCLVTSTSMGWKNTNGCEVGYATWWYGIILSPEVLCASNCDFSWLWTFASATYAACFLGVMEALLAHLCVWRSHNVPQSPESWQHWWRALLSFLSSCPPMSNSHSRGWTRGFRRRNSQHSHHHLENKLKLLKPYLCKHCLYQKARLYCQCWLLSEHIQGPAVEQRGSSSWSGTQWRSQSRQKWQNRMNSSLR